MADPAKIDLVQGAVTKIATNVTAGVVRNLSRDTVVFFTTRITGGAAPSASAMATEMCLMFSDDNVSEEISNSVAIDIYVMSPNSNASIRVDLP